MAYFIVDIKTRLSICLLLSCILSALLAASSIAAESKSELANLKKKLEGPASSALSRSAINDALTKLNAILAREKTNSEALYLRAVVYEKMENRTKELEDLDACLKIDPKNGMAHWYRGILFFGKDFRLAINDFDAAIANGAAKPAVYSNRGAAYLQVDQKKKALQDFDTAINMDPSQPFPRMMRAELNQGMGHSQDAIKDCDLVFADKSIPRSELGWVHKTKGSALFALGKYQEAVTELNIAIDGLQGQDKAKAVYLRGAAYHKLDKEDLAQADAKLARSLGFKASDESNGPEDKLIQSNADEKAKIEEAIKPLVAKARKTLPAAKARYLKGLAPSEVFFVTYKLNDGAKSEQIFVKVDSWKGDKIEGTIASKIHLPHNHEGDKLQVSEKDVVDWTIRGAKGKEDGNIVGKFLDTWKP